MAMKVIPTKVHGVFDYLMVGTLIALPQALGWSGGVTRLLTNAGLGTLGYSLLTRYELGLVRVLPMKGHLALDGLSGALLCAAPFLLLDDDEDGDLTAPLVGLGLFELVVTLLSQSTPGFSRQGERESESSAA